MSPGAPTERLPCEGMVEESEAMLGKLAGAGEVVAETHHMLSRHLSALKSCRERCYIRNASQGGQG